MGNVCDPPSPAGLKPRTRLIRNLLFCLENTTTIGPSRLISTPRNVFLYRSAPGGLLTSQGRPQPTAKPSSLARSAAKIQPTLVSPSEAGRALPAIAAVRLLWHMPRQQKQPWRRPFEY